MHPIWGEYVSMGWLGSKQLHLVWEMFSYVKYTHSLLGSLKGLTTVWIEALTFTSPALNLRSRSKILASILKVRFDKFKLRWNISLLMWALTLFWWRLSLMTWPFVKWRHITPHPVHFLEFHRCFEDAPPCTA